MSHLPILSRKKASIIQAAITYLTTFISIIQGLILVPMYLEIIGPRMYGLWLGSGGVLIALSFLDLGLGRIITQRVAQTYGKEEYKKAGEYFISGLSIYFIIGSTLLILGYLLSYFLPEWLGAENSEVIILRNCFQIAVFVMFFKIMNDCIRGFQTALLRPKVPMIGLLIFQIIGVIISLIILLSGYGLFAIPIGNLVIQFGSFVVNSIHSKKLLYKLIDRLTFNRKLFRELLEFSPSLILGRMGSTGTKQIEPTLITLFLSPQITSFFFVTRKAADLVSQLIHVLIGSVFSSYSHLVGESNKKKTIDTTKVIINITYFLGVMGIGLYIMLNESFVNLWVDDKHYLGLSITVLIGLGILIRILQDLLTELLIGLGVIKRVNYLIFLEGVLRVGIMSILIANLGVKGAPLGMIIMCSIFAFFYMVMMLKKLEIKINTSTLFKYFMYVFVFIFISYFISNNISISTNWLRFTLITLVVLFLSTILFLSLKKFRTLLNKILRIYINFNN